MKILVCGKGGSGKSTLSVMLARAFEAMGKVVLLVDADESNFGIPHLIGVDAPCDLMESFGGKKGFKEKLNAKFPADGEGVFDKKQSISDLASECISETGSIRVVTVGKIHHFDEGCACPMGILSKKFLSSLVVGGNEVVIVDTEAGVEHFGRGVIAEGDLILGVVDPTAESFRLVEKMREMASVAQKPVYFVLNKTEPDIESYMTSTLDPELVVEKIPKDNRMFMASLRGEPIREAGPQVSALADRLGGVELSRI
ncbi:MAG: P-loop NTPase [Desulfobacteraceae bacterium]|nr:P-loop NTPase [Desulfobacteraceae bacterium]MCF8095035.1 P-loop NTPase [Desulfobacteraceae bacterium]